MLGAESGNAPAQLQVSIDAAGLAPGVYSGQITIAAEGAENSPQTVSVEFTITALQPLLQVNPVSLSFTMQEGAGACLRLTNVGIANGGTGTPDRTASVSDGWIQLNAINGSAPATLQVSINPEELVAGDYSGQITIDAGSAQGSPSTVSVTLHIDAIASEPLLQVSPSSLSFIIPVGGDALDAQEVAIANAGTGTLNWTATASVDWINSMPSMAAHPPPYR